MTDKFKKIDRQYVLSDSSVNEYGFRLLTSGYQIDAYRKNPIGYYMHRREDGIALKWDDLKIDGDTIVGTPVINLTNPRGEQLCAEVANGFLNAASMGHIIVLEYSVSPDMMLPGQTGPTITKWYNKECSLVDIPGNSNSLSKLYDVLENEINLVNMGAGMKFSGFVSPETLQAIAGVLQLNEVRDANIILEGLQNLAGKANALELESNLLRNDKAALQQQIDEINRVSLKLEIATILDRALEDKKITIELKDRLVTDYANNKEGLKALIASMPAYRLIAEQLNSRATENATTEWKWDDFEKNDPTGKKLKELRANNPVRYKELFDEKFGG